MKVLKQIKESLIFALNTLKVNRLRTVLTLLGITIGIFAIIAFFIAAHIFWCNNDKASAIFNYKKAIKAAEYNYKWLARENTA